MVMITLVIGLSIIYSGCTKRDPLASVNEGTEANWAYAVLLSIEPDSAKPFETVTIKGAGFYSETSMGFGPKDNDKVRSQRKYLPLVWFGVDTAHVNWMTQDELNVIVPPKLDKKGNIDSTYSGVGKVRVALYGSLNWSNKIEFKILPLKEEPEGL